MKKWLITILTAIAVAVIAAVTAHFVGVKSWETCFSAGAGVGIAEILRERFLKKRSATTQNHH